MLTFHPTGANRAVVVVEEEGVPIEAHLHPVEGTKEDAPTAIEEEDEVDPTTTRIGADATMALISGATVQTIIEVVAMIPTTMTPMVDLASKTIKSENTTT